MLVRKFEALGVKDPTPIVVNDLKYSHCLCILDGLDEVRPALQEDVYSAINSLVAAFFSMPYPLGQLIVTCRKEAYRSIPLHLREIQEVVPLKDDQVKSFAKSWPLGYPSGKSADSFWTDLSASPKILEASRSPLLLVGSLLLYTESNLGIPGERTKYFEKIKRTLVEDWSTAQGHVPDPWTNAYTPLLSNIALRMHLDRTTELRRQDCINLMTSLLPQYGYEAVQADLFLEKLFTRTGILVGEVPGSVIFVQFVLQEYFASLAMVSNYSPDQIAELAGESWWREAILFMIAQERDPTPYINALFQSAPMIGSMAVGEAPTPSSQLQQNAIEIVLRELDNADGAVGVPIVSLLRKISGNIERLFCTELGQRLGDEDTKVSAIAGRTLATAGTSIATDTLSKCPEAWEHCLGTSNYISDAFEKLLLSWVGAPSQPHWRQAVDALVSFQEKVDFKYLIELLEKLPNEKADYLATAILRRLDKKPPQQQQQPFLSDSQMHYVCDCTPYVNDIEQLQKSLTPHGPYNERTPPAMVATALALTGRSKDTAKQRICHKVYHTLGGSIVWSSLRSSYLLMLSSAAPSFALLVKDHYLLMAYVILGLSAVLAIVAAGISAPFPPWLMDTYHPSDIPDPSSDGVDSFVAYAFLLGVSLALAAALPDSFLPKLSPPQPFYVILFMIFTVMLARRALDETIHTNAAPVSSARFYFVIASSVWLLLLCYELCHLLLPHTLPSIPHEFLSMATVASIIIGYFILQLLLAFIRWHFTLFANLKARAFRMPVMYADLRSYSPRVPADAREHQ
jgi:hypothetical protein